MLPSLVCAFNSGQDLLSKKEAEFLKKKKEMEKQQQLMKSQVQQAAYLWEMEGPCVLFFTFALSEKTKRER